MAVEVVVCESTARGQWHVAMDLTHLLLYFIAKLCLVLLFAVLHMYLERERGQITEVNTIYSTGGSTCFPLLAVCKFPPPNGTRPM